MKRLLIIGSLVALIIGGFIGYKMFNKAPESVGTMDTDFKISAAALLEAFENDEEAANAKYLDKAVVVTGKIADKKVEGGKTTLYLDTGNPLSTIMCQFEKDSPSIPDNQENITIKGICSGFLSDVVLVRSIVL